MTTKTNDVAIAWIKSLPARTKTYYTDGTKLYSYELLIGDTYTNQKVVYNYTAPNNFQSQTTSRHVRLVANFPNVTLIDP